VAVKNDSFNNFRDREIVCESLINIVRNRELGYPRAGMDEAGMDEAGAAVYGVAGYHVGSVELALACRRCLPCS